MRIVWTIFEHRMRSYFGSPNAYMVGGLFLVLAGLFFVLPFFFGTRDASLRNWMGSIIVFLLFMAPMFRLTWNVEVCLLTVFLTSSLRTRRTL